MGPHQPADRGGEVPAGPLQDVAASKGEGGGARPPVRPAAPPPAKDQQLETVYRQYIDARLACNLPIDNVTREKLAEAINRQKPALMDKYRCKDVDFIVVIEGGKPSLKARPKNS